jgi:putative component of membrane protein insertase Oxa1/YidC/SpoIIIJ protein YidD
MERNKPGSFAVVDIIHRVYKRAISPLFGNACRFYPKLSVYSQVGNVK